jgi:hypothetical protein
MRRSFLIQTEGTSPALSRPPAVQNQGGTLNFKSAAVIEKKNRVGGWFPFITRL